MSVSEEELKSFLERFMKCKNESAHSSIGLVEMMDKEKMLTVLNQISFTIENLGECKKFFDMLPSIGHVLGALCSTSSLSIDQEISKSLLECLGKLHFPNGVSELERTSSQWVMNLISLMLHSDSVLDSRSSERDGLLTLPTFLGFSERENLGRLRKEMLSIKNECDRPNGYGMEINEEQMHQLCRLVEPLLPTLYIEEAVNYFLEYVGSSVSMPTFNERFLRTLQNSLNKLSNDVVCQIFQFWPFMFENLLKETVEKCLRKIQNVPELNEDSLRQIFKEEMEDLVKQVSDQSSLLPIIENSLQSLLICDKQQQNSSLHLILAVFVDCFWELSKTLSNS